MVGVSRIQLIGWIWSFYKKKSLLFALRYWLPSCFNDAEENIRPLCFIYIAFGKSLCSCCYVVYTTYNARPGNTGGVWWRSTLTLSKTEYQCCFMCDCCQLYCTVWPVNDVSDRRTWSSTAQWLFSNTLYILTLPNETARLFSKAIYTFLVLR
jgi:hypothetical protein